MNAKNKIRYHLRKIIGVNVVLVISYFIFQSSQRDGFELELYITEVAVALTIMVLGLLYWTFQPEIKKLTEKIETEKRNHDPKRLNNLVYKKLMRVVCLESRLFFNNNYGFCIPKNPMVFENPVDSSYLAWTTQLRTYKNFEDEFDPIDKAISNLKIGENFLEKNYNRTYQLWNKIKQELEHINKERNEFFLSIAKQIGKDIKKELNYEPRFILGLFDEEPVFFEDNIKKILPLLFNTKVTNFTLEEYYKDGYYVRYGDSFFIIGSHNKEKINLGAIEMIFRRVILDTNFIKKNIDFQYSLIELNQTITNFCIQLETEVVNDIDNTI